MTISHNQDWWRRRVHRLRAATGIDVAPICPDHDVAAVEGEHPRLVDQEIVGNIGQDIAAVDGEDALIRSGFRQRWRGHANNGTAARNKHLDIATLLGLYLAHREQDIALANVLLGEQGCCQHPPLVILRLVTAILGNPAKLGELGIEDV